MRIAVISDIHANWPALQVVTADARQHDVNAYWCLGDVVGRGPQPGRCWEHLAETLTLSPAAWVAGNHDWGVLNRLEAPVFMTTSTGIEAIVGDFALDWQVLQQQRAVLERTPQVLASLAGLALVASPLPGVFLAHGVVAPTPRECVGTYARVHEHAEESMVAAQTLLPMLQDEINSARTGGLNLTDAVTTKLPKAADERTQLVCIGFDWQAPRLTMVGHTHVACAWQRRAGANRYRAWVDKTMALHATALVDDEVLWLEAIDQQPVFANPGSVGFSRDAPPGHACYLLVEWQAQRVGLTLRRVPYDPTETIRLMKRSGTPEAIINLLRPR